MKFLFVVVLSFLCGSPSMAQIGENSKSVTESIASTHYPSHYQSFINWAKAEMPSLFTPVDPPQTSAYSMDFPVGWRPFSDSSPWNTPIAGNATTHPMSSTIINYIYNTKGQKFIRFGNTYLPPIWSVNSSMLAKNYAYSQTHIVDTWDLNKDNISDQPVPISTSMFFEPTSDGHISIIDRSLGKAFEMSRAKWSGSQLQCTTFNIWDTNGSGASSPSGLTYWQFQGGRGSGFPVVAGCILGSDIKAGVIKHALVFTLEDCRDASNGQIFLPPACRSDGTIVDSTKPIQGMRFQLVATENDLTSWGLNENAKIVARCLMTYGAYLGDRGGNGAIQLQLRGNSTSDNRAAWEAIAPGMYNSVSKIPLNKLRVIYTGEPIIKYE